MTAPPAALPPGTRIDDYDIRQWLGGGGFGLTYLARDRQLDNTFCKDAQVVAIRGARNYRGDRLIRTTKPHRILDPAAGPLIAVRLNILTRKTLGGLHTDLSARVLTAVGEPLPGVYAAGEVAGFDAIRRRRPR